MKTSSVFATVPLSLMLLSFTPPGAPSAPALRTGTYGVCGCGSATGGDLSLVLHNDHSFHYVNGTDRDKLVDVTGSWEMVGNKVRLTTDADPDFGTWTVDKNTDCLRSRKGLQFTRLCHLEACH